jgi:hypothetical protein
VNNTRLCRPPRLVIFRSSVPSLNYALDPVPAQYITNGCQLRLVLKYGTLALLPAASDTAAAKRGRPIELESCGRSAAAKLTTPPDPPQATQGEDRMLPPRTGMAVGGATGAVASAAAATAPPDAGDTQLGLEEIVDHFFAATPGSPVEEMLGELASIATKASDASEDELEDALEAALLNGSRSGSSPSMSRPSVPPSPPGATPPDEGGWARGLREVRVARAARPGWPGRSKQAARQSSRWALVPEALLRDHLTGLSVLAQLMGLCQLSYKRASAAESEVLFANTVVGGFSAACVAVRAITLVTRPDAATALSAWMVRRMPDQS